MNLFEEKSNQQTVARDLPAVEGGTPVRDQMLVFGQPSLGVEEEEGVISVLRSRWIGTGRRTAEFEQRFREYVEADFAIAMSSCTAALHASLTAADIGTGDEVITTPLTFVSTVNAIVLTGAQPVLVDIDERSFNITPAATHAALTDRTRAVIPVHYAGLPCDIAGFRTLASDADVTLVEDAAHAVGARWAGHTVGAGNSLTCFSFYPNKNLTSGEGGMVTTDDEALSSRLQILRLHGLSADAWKRYSSKKVLWSDMIDFGYKYNMTDIQAAIGIAQLSKQESFLQIRSSQAARYDAYVDHHPGLTRQARPEADELNRHALHLYVIRINPAAFRVSRDDLFRAMRAENIGVGLHYRPVHLHPYYLDRLDLSGKLPVSERLGDEIMSLPLTPAMNDEDVTDVLTALDRVLAFYAV